MDQTLAFLESADRLTFDQIEYNRRVLILDALGKLNQILNGINYLGFPENIIPIQSWRYLQNAARYFANQAIQAERTYINFKDHAEQEEFSRLMLEQAVDAQLAALVVEVRRVKVPEEQKRVTWLNANLANTRLGNAVDQRKDYDEMSKELVYLDQFISFANASDRKVYLSQEWASLLGIEQRPHSLMDPSTGFYLPYWPGNYLVQTLTRKRSQLTRKYELQNMQRQINELTSAKAVADSQVDEAQKMVHVAEVRRDLA